MSNCSLCGGELKSRNGFAQAAHTSSNRHMDALRAAVADERTSPAMRGIYSRTITEVEIAKRNRKGGS